MLQVYEILGQESRKEHAVTETQTESVGTDKAGVTGSNGAQNKTQVDQPDTESLITTEQTTSQDNTQENTQETMAEGILQYYTIKEGDTLMSISIKMYKSPEYVDALMNANGIKEGDTIYPGEKIAKDRPEIWCGLCGEERPQ